MNPATVSRMASALGITEAPMTRTNIAMVVDFFLREFRIDLASNTYWQLYFDYLRGIDYHQPVTIEQLPAGTQLSRHEPPGGRPKPFTYYTKPGTSQFSTGTSFPSSTYKLYCFPGTTRALVSRAAGINFSHRDPVSRGGGGIQYIISTSAPTTLVHEQSKPGPRIR